MKPLAAQDIFTKSKQTRNEIRLQALQESDMYQDYVRAFTDGTGLPLVLHGPEMLTVTRYPKRQENPFSAMVSKVKEVCAFNYVAQCKLELEAHHAPKTSECFAGLCETAVPVRVGENLIGFLRTGQILLERPDIAGFENVAATLLKWGSRIDLNRLKEAYFKTRVISAKQYDALIKLLETFAKHLASRIPVLILNTPQANASSSMTRARTFIADHSDENLSLTTVAQVANMSATYFSGKFKEATSINFVEFVARTRIEKSCNLLLNPNLRISEIAFKVGFQSLSQFNRSFRQVVGESPRAHRTKLSLH